MGAILGAIIVFVVIAAVFGSSATGGYDKLVATGLPARGILLQVSSIRQPGGQSGVRRFVRRQVTIDVEIPGQPPYETSLSLYIPSNLDRDVLPGATVELRVDPKDSTSVALVGPGAGFAATLLGTTQADQRAA